MTMEININSGAEINNFLVMAEANDWKWVAFDSIIGQVDRFYGFESAKEAIDFCAAGNSAFDYLEQDFVMADYRFLALDTLRSAVNPADTDERPALSVTELSAQLQEQGVEVLSGHDLKNNYQEIVNGLVFTVQFDRVIEPAQEADRFIVVEHQHAGHQVYEIGHSIKVMDTFTSMEQAEAYFQALLVQSPIYMDKPDYQLIGLYRGQAYQHDLDGAPENFSGLILQSAYHQYDTVLQAKAWSIHTLNKLDETQQFRHYLYARYDPENGQIHLLDDRLKPVQLQNINSSTYPAHLLNETLTIKNLNIMNEQSYDYVKNQLLYLGFGEEIAGPLREKMEQGEKEFTLDHSRSFGKDQTNNVLHFSKGDDHEKDLTFFNRFDMTLKQEGKENLTQNFFIGKEYNYTLQERYNMMDGRFVYREQPKVAPKEVNGETKMVPTGETYVAWKGLDFKATDERGNFVPKTMFWNHQKEINKYPLKEVAEPYNRNRLLAAMEKGNRANVTILRNEQEIKGTVTANPRMQRFDFYDANGQTLFVKKTEAIKQENSATQAQGVQKEQQPAQNQQQDQSKNQGENQQAQTGQREDQKNKVAEDQQNVTGQRKKTGMKI